MYENEHRFFAKALVLSLVACVAFVAALSIAPYQKAYADEPTRASGYTEVQLLEYINTNMETLLTGLGMLGENTSQTHPAFRWLHDAIVQINQDSFQNRIALNTIRENTQYTFNRLTEIRAALVADTIEINGQVQTTVRNYARLAAEHTDSMTTILQAWNRDMGASQNGTGTDATWFSTVSSRLLATLNAINSANTNLISIDSKFWEYFLVPQRWQQQDGSYYYSPAYYLQYVKQQYDMMTWALVSRNQISIDGTTYKTPHYYLDRMNDHIAGLDYIPGMKTDTDLLVKLLSQDTVTISGQTVNTPYYYLKNALEPYNGHTLNFWVEKIYEALSKSQILNPNNQNSTVSSPWTYLGRIYTSIGDSANKYINGSTLTNTLSRFSDSWNSFVLLVHDYLDSLVYLLETPDSSTSQQLIGDFDDDAYEQNMADLKQKLGRVGVFSAVTSLGMIVYTISDVDSLQTPSLDVPFEFAGSNDHLVIDLSWLDDFKPMINFACMALLFLQLSAWTVEAVKET